ncbi:MAG: CPBP family intramembrane metalloprotease [Epulopiscium sp.]|nr:CPBP family intramembrane metalloprotease [Candidatus Epulonipiscium sp.]
MNAILKSNLFAGILLLLQLFGAFFLILIPGFMDLPLPIILILTQTLFLLVPTTIYFIVTKAPVKKTLRFNWPGFFTILLTLLFAIFVQPAMMFLSALSGLFFNNNISEIVTKLNSYPLILMIGVIALTPAICEEVTMRGILLSGYDNVDIKKAMLLNGLFFGMLHADLQQFLYAFALGAIFSYLVRLTDSIIPSMVAHFTINGSQLLMQRFISHMATFTGQDLSTLASIEPTLYDKLIALGFIAILAVIITPIAGILLYAIRDMNINKKRKDDKNLSNHKVFNWPVWVSIGIFIPYMVITLSLQYILDLLDKF